MTPLHGIACFYDVGFGARAVSRKTPIYFISDESESGTWNTFRCLRKLPQFATDSESERMYIFLSPEAYFRNQEKM